VKGPAEHLPEAVFLAAQVRELERLAIASGIPSYDLMCRAGAAALGELLRRWPGTRRIVVVCGAGNNAGDGYVVARLARAAGLAVTAFAVTAPERLKGDAQRAVADCGAAGVAIESFSAAALAVAAGEVYVDALLGTGVDRDVTGAFLAAIDALNAVRAPVFALDLPSGLDADSGRPHAAAVRAAATITFLGLKQGLFLGAAVDYVGELSFSDLGIPGELARAQAPALERLTARELDRALPRRARSAHKGSNGRLLLLGGGPGMAGAVRLAAEAALRTGAGLVYVATHPDNVAAVLAGRPEIICHGVRAERELDVLVGLADAVAVGPGLGLGDWARPLWRRLLETRLPLVVDADGLNLLAAEPRRREDWILTPHPAEAARLLGLSSANEVQADRLAAVRDLTQRYGAAVVLKGAHTLVAGSSDAAVAVCDRGNPGMATAGTGDVLTGVIGALLVQTRDVATSARVGVLLHALAGDSAALAGERGMVASDLLPQLRQWANRT
jgi:NAD(P)H-hydrate epimerase